jgi:hypothetical protein
MELPIQVPVGNNPSVEDEAFARDVTWEICNRELETHPVWAS